MPDRAPRCPSCSYDLTGVMPKFLGNPSPEDSTTCPECGRSVTLLAALITIEPDPAPKVTFTLMAICALAWLLICGGCLTYFSLGLRP